jgi:hypothetical protein
MFCSGDGGQAVRARSGFYFKSIKTDFSQKSKIGISTSCFCLHEMKPNLPQAQLYILEIENLRKENDF